MKWRLELLSAVHPKEMRNTLNLLGMARVDDAFGSDSGTLIEFLDTAFGEIPYRGDPMMRKIAQELQALSDGIKEEVKNTADFKLITRAWLSTRDDEVRLFDPVEAHKVSISVAGTEPIAERLAANGPLRHFGFDSGTLGRLEELKTKTPNFTEVVDCIQDAASLATRYNRPITVIPILTVGEPGIGKTYFTDQLSKFLEVPLRRIAMDSFQSGSVLTGSAYIWSNTEVGEVFRGLVEGTHISPLVILDEIDKANDTYRHHDSDSLSALHSLLELGSARHFNDASFPLSIDASHVIWIATANDITKIPKALISRMDVFEISEPTSEQYREILEQIWWALSEEYPGISFDEKVLEVLADKTPREQRQLLQFAIARAARTGKRKTTIEHLGKVTSTNKVRPATALGYRRQDVWG